MTDPDFANYLKWILDNGGTYKKIEFRDGCVHTTDAIESNENFATVPFKLCITEKKAREALPTLSEFSSRTVLTLFLLLEKEQGEKSFYWPYINILPKTIKTPLFFDENDIQFIQNTNLESALRDRKAALFNEYEKLLEGAELTNVKWEDFLWCYSVYSSRSFPYTLIDPNHQGASEVLFPLVDALNHKPNTKIVWSRSGDAETGSLSFVAGQEFDKGIEIFNNYGPKSNEELLLGYGFCFEYNEHDHVALKPNFSRDPNCEVKLKILEQCNLSSGNIDPFTFYIHRNSIPIEFLKIMRVLTMNSIETESYSLCSNSKLLDFVGYRNELSMLSTTLILLEDRLERIKAVSLPTVSLTDCQRFALMYRAGQQDIFDITVKKVEAMKHILIQMMCENFRNKRIAPVAPFLNILNSEYYQHQYDDIEVDNEESSAVTADTVLITTQILLDKHPEFRAAISSLFQDSDEEEDVIMMLSLIKENSNINSKWREFFDKTNVASNCGIQQQDLRELYDDTIPGFAEEYPDIFDLNTFSFEALVWADSLLNDYSIDSPFSIVPL